MQPYQTASEEIRRQTEAPGKTLKNLGAIGSSIVGGAAATGALRGVLSKVLPFFSSQIPMDLATKGLSKVDPRIGNFLNKATQAGYGLKDAFSFFKDKASQGVEEASQPKDQRSIIEQYSPELHQFLVGEIKKGRSPFEAGAIAQLQKPFMKIIEKIQKDHKTSFSSILQSIFGGGQTAQSKSALQPILNAEERDLPGFQRKAPIPTPQPQASQNIPPQPMQQSQQMGPGAQQLMQAIQQFRQRRGG